MKEQFSFLFIRTVDFFYNYLPNWNIFKEDEQGSKILHSSKSRVSTRMTHMRTSHKIQKILVNGKSNLLSLDSLAINF